MGFLLIAIQQILLLGAILGWLPTFGQGGMTISSYLALAGMEYHGRHDAPGRSTVPEDLDSKYVYQFM